MSTHVSGFQAFSVGVFASFCIGQISHQQHKSLKLSYAEHASCSKSRPYAFLICAIIFNLLVNVLTHKVAETHAILVIQGRE